MANTGVGRLANNQEHQDRPATCDLPGCDGASGCQPQTASLVCEMHQTQ
jgi:hypothetical protein